MRPRLLASLTVVAVALGAGCNSGATSTVPPPSSPPGKGAVKHIVILLQENRSFNIMFAGFPGATTAMSGKCKIGTKYCPKSGVVALKATTLESSNQAGFRDDISHSHAAFEVECDPNASNLCQLDGFNQITTGQGLYGSPAKDYPYSYIERKETKAYWDFAKQYGLADKFFFTDTASSFIAHQMILSGTVELNGRESLTDQPSNPPWGCDAFPGTTTPVIFKNGRVSQYGPFPCFTQWGTIADLLDAKKVSWKYYVQPVRGEFSGSVWNGFDAIKKIRYGPDWRGNIVTPETKVFSDLKNGALPSLSWVIPELVNSDHSASGCNYGPRWVTDVLNAIGTSQYWNSTAVIVLWDDWGGWYDPVPPPQTNYTSLGFRVPVFVVSPYAKTHNVSHTQYEFGSILKFIEETFGLGSLGTTDATATSIGDMFDVMQPPTPYKVEPKPSVRNCGATPPPAAIIAHDHGIPE
ncbi:MAG: hypothetical protein JO078_10800 [Candidatus Eremiobacteraeota bacterium]|nr:hypothetical protein [Candidatus Eremiobacteraeota bacterium]